jgi:hypothetical protein
MTDAFPAWMASLTASEQRWLAVLMILVVVLILMYLFRDPLNYWREGRRIAWSAKRLGARMLHDISLPDGMGGDINLDFLVLAPDAILVIGVKRYDGLIFGSPRTDEWTQVINSRSYKFPNPDTHLKQQISAVRILLPKIPVRGLHLFTDNAVFPKDKPANVLQAKDLHRLTRRPGMKEIPAELRTAWERLVASLK